MKQGKLSKRALALGVCCTLALGMAPGLSVPGSSGIVHAAEAGGEASQETQDTVAADPGQAQEYALEAITVEAKRPDWESKLSPGTVTIIRPDDYKGEQKTLPELLKDVPGVHVRYLSGKGQYTTVTVRGSTAAQVGVFVDGVLSNLGGDAAVDISTIPINNVERIEVYRGYIPARFGGTYMGGVINIVTKKPDKANISAQIGKSSWGGTTAGLEITQPLGKGSLMIGINRDQSDGDFRYKNPGVRKAYGEALQQYNQLTTTMLTDYNTALTAFIEPILGSLPPFTSLEEVQQATTVGSAFYNAVQSAIVTGGLGTQDDVDWIFSDPSVLGYDPDFKQKYWAARPELDSETRYRRNNDYKNTDAIIKWQDDHWLVKGSWKKIDRGLPQRTAIEQDIWSTGYLAVDLPGLFERKRQELTSKDLLVGRRDTEGSLEWGWQLNYLDQDKRYSNPDYGKLGGIPRMLDKWSSYDSRRFGGAIDGTYKVGDNHMLEFLANWSKEKMDIDGSRMDKYDYEPSLTNRERFRSYYEHTLFNLQLQDTITLNQAADLWLTPSIRYNYSNVMGRSLGKSSQNKWLDQEDSQVNDKVTWQLALKKQVDDHLTLRSTYGTYYRLLNMYEIAGDGAGILPRPNAKDDDRKYGGQSLFPLPEEGTQWDLSAIWDGKLLGAESSKVQLTYFGRDSKNILQLYRFGPHFWSYTNATKGRANGVELQADFHWDKWDMNLAGTYLHTRQYDKFNQPDSFTGDKFFWMPQLYTPEWEGSMRLTYRPDNRLAIFGELKYIDEMYCWQNDPQKVQSSLTTVGLGAKYKIDKDCQIIAGVNDIFDKGPEMTFTTGTYGGMQANQNKLTEYPLQGRTYYVTLQYKY